MEQFASGWKRNYYGKGDVIAYRLNRDGVTADQQAPVFGASVKMLLYGDAFRPTYNRGDNTGLIATDSMKNFIQRETLNYTGRIWNSCHFLATEFLLSASGGFANLRHRNPARRVATWQCRVRSRGAGGAPGGTRTPGLLIRSQSLYPAELRARVASSYHHYIGDRNRNQAAMARLRGRRPSLG